MGTSSNIAKDIREHVTPDEVELAVEVENEKQKNFYKMMAWIGYNCAALSGIAMNDPKKFPSLEESFPTLFENKEQQDWRIMKERIEGWATMKGRYVSETQ